MRRDAPNNVEQEEYDDDDDGGEGKENDNDDSDDNGDADAVAADDNDDDDLKVTISGFESTDEACAWDRCCIARKAVEAEDVDILGIVKEKVDSAGECVRWGVSLPSASYVWTLKLRIVSPER